MKNRGFILSMWVVLGILMSCTAQTTGQQEESASVPAEKVQVYYFHFEHRCATCLAVESVSENALKDLYPEKVMAGDITFQSVNLDEKASETLADELKVRDQTLLIIKGENRKNLTNEAFLYARTNPEKLKGLIKESVDNL